MPGTAAKKLRVSVRRGRRLPCPFAVLGLHAVVREHVTGSKFHKCRLLQTPAVNALRHQMVSRACHRAAATPSRVVLNALRHQMVSRTALPAIRERLEWCSTPCGIRWYRALNITGRRGIGMYVLNALRHQMVSRTTRASSPDCCSSVLNALRHQMVSRTTDPICRRCRQRAQRLAASDGIARQLDGGAAASRRVLNALRHQMVSRTCADRRAMRRLSGCSTPSGIRWYRAHHGGGATGNTVECSTPSGIRWYRAAACRCVAGAVCACSTPCGIRWYRAARRADDRRLTGRVLNALRHQMVSRHACRRQSCGTTEVLNALRHQMVSRGPAPHLVTRVLNVKAHGCSTPCGI